jgi:hypothetical protein
MRVGDNMPPLFRVIASVLWSLGIALNLVLAVSPLWRWHQFLGWGASIVLLTLVWDERRSIQAALGRHGRAADRIFAFYLLTAAIVALLVNTAVAFIAA